MNIKQIKENYTCLDWLGVNAVKKTSNGWIASCPWRPDRHPSLTITNNGKGWYDWATGEHGGVIELVSKCLNTTDFKAICKAFADKVGSSPITPVFDVSKEKGEVVQTPFNIVPLSSIPLLSYLESRGISLAVAGQFLQEVRWANPQNPDRCFFGIAYHTDEGGWCMRNKLSKRVFGRGGITTHFLSETQSTVIFEGFFDMLSWVVLTEGKQKSNFIVLNSVANVQMAISRIREGFPSKTIYLALDNDKAGDVATAALLAAFPEAKDLRQKYSDFNDLNEYLCGLPGRAKMAGG